MPSAAFLRAMGAENVKPVILLQVESGSADRVSLSTQDQWQACPVLDGWDAAALPGSVIPAGTIYPMLATVEAARTNLLIGAVKGRYTIANTHGHTVGPHELTVTLTLKKNGVDAGTAEARMSFPQQLGTYYTGDVYFVLPEEVGFLPGDEIDVASITHVITGSSVGVYHSGGSNWAAPPELVTRTATGTLTTAALGLAAAPSSHAVIHFDDSQPPGASIAYSAEGSSNGSSWTPLGAVADGQQLTAYRYYRITAAFSWTGTDYPEIREIRIISGDGSYLYYSTHRDEPYAAALPYLADKPVGTISSKITLLDKPSTGEASVKMFWNDHVSALLAAGTLLNKTVSIRIGAVGMASGDYETLFTGTWHDYSIDFARGLVTIKLRDVLKLLGRSKVPRESTNATTGLRSTRPLVFVDRPILSALLDIADAQGIPDRFLARDQFAALEAAGVDYPVTRTLPEPTEADKLLAELTATAGVFLVPSPQGALAPVLYDPDGDPAGVLDARDVDFGSIEGGLKELRTRQLVYYDPLTEDPGDNSEDYARGVIYANNALEAQLQEKEVSEKRWYDKWRAPEGAILALAARMNSWFSTPHQTVTASGVPLRHLGLQPGQVVTVDNLPLPSSEWPGLSTGRKFLITGRDFDAGSLSLKLTLFDLQTEGTPGAGVVGTDLVISGPDNPYGPYNVYTVAGGSGPYAWQTTAGTLSSPTGTSVSLDVNNLTGAATISVTDPTGKVTKRLQIAPTTPAAGTATGTFGGVHLVFPGVVLHPGDVLHVYAGPTSDPATAEWIGSSATNEYTHPVSPGNPPLYYWVRVINAAELPSDLSNPLQAAAQQILESHLHQNLRTPIESITLGHFDDDILLRVIADAGQSVLREAGDILSAAAIDEERTVRADAYGALALDITTLQSTVGDNTASIQTQAESVDGLRAQLTFKVDVNGFLAGLGLASEAVDGQPFSRFYVMADQHAFINPAASVLTVSSITRSGSTATATTSVAHGLAVGDAVVLTGAAQHPYNGSQVVTEIVNSTQFRFIVAGTPATPATVADGFPGLRCAKAVIPLIVQDGQALLNTAIIKELSADKIKGGGIRGINVNSASHTTRGSYLTSAASAGATTLNLHSTEDFPTSGSGWIIDSTNDRDAFSWTGKTATTLIGCSGVLAHSVEATVIPQLKNIVIDDKVNEMRFFGDQGNGVITELLSIGLFSGTQDVLMRIGGSGLSYVAIAADGTVDNYLAEFFNLGDGHGVVGRSGAAGYGGVYGQCMGADGYGVAGYSGAGYGGRFIGGKSPLILDPSASASAPTHASAMGALWVTSTGVLYINTSGSTTWQKVGEQ